MINNYNDVVAYAAQTGRLDLVTAVLAAIAILFVFSAFPLFFFIRHRAKQVALDAIEEEINQAETKIEERAISKIESLLPRLIDEYMELVKNSVSDSNADQIAAAAGGQGHNGDNDRGD
jgi:hypothetical protein